MKFTLSLIISFFIGISPVLAQAGFRVMFYNVENFFDTVDDPDKDDDEFLPEGSKKWTEGRYQNKLNNIAHVITSVGEFDAPVLVGMCEIENEKVLDDLTRQTSLKKSNYRYAITDSDDARGIDVALLYQPDKFKRISERKHKITFPRNSKKVTRDILHVSGRVASGDTLDVFVCHFPSRREGESESEPNRVHVASVLRAKTDSLMRTRQKAYIIIMGDFNDEPSNKSISQTLGAKSASHNANNKRLYNLFSKFQKQKNKGSYKYRDQWNVLDQIIVSGSLLNRDQQLGVMPETATIFQRDFLLVEDKTNGGKRPKKTYHGRRHEGGFSDHLPIYVDFFVDGYYKISK